MRTALRRPCPSCWAVAAEEPASSAAAVAVRWVAAAWVAAEAGAEVACLGRRVAQGRCNAC